MIPEEKRIPYRATDPTGRRALVIAPHPDDETFGCGGTLALHARAGDEVKVLFLTSGDRGDTSGRIDRKKYMSIREAEAKEACRRLGVHDLEFWAYPDRALGQFPDAIERMHDLLERYAPRTVYAPSPLEVHPDHIAAADQFFEAVRYAAAEFRVVMYEVNQPLRVNSLVDITPVLENKIHAFAAYASQLRELPYQEISLALNRFRSVTLPAAVTHAEGFSTWSSRELKNIKPADFAAALFKQ